MTPPSHGLSWKPARETEQSDAYPEGSAGLLIVQGAAARRDVLKRGTLNASNVRRRRGACIENPWSHTQALTFRVPPNR